MRGMKGEGSSEALSVYVPKHSCSRLSKLDVRDSRSAGGVLTSARSTNQKYLSRAQSLC